MYDGTAYRKLEPVYSIRKVTLEYHRFTSLFGGPNLPSVMAEERNVQAFDGKKGFNHFGFSQVSLSGPNAGGGCSNEYGEAGTFTIKNRALIDGRLFLVRKVNENNNANKNNTNATKEKKAEDKNTVTSTAKALSGAELLKKANLAHGGKNLDNIKTLHMQFKASSANANAKVFIDVVNQRIRYKIYGSGKLFKIQQASGSEGWQWA